MLLNYWLSSTVIFFLETIKPSSLCLGSQGSLEPIPTITRWRRVHHSGWVPSRETSESPHEIWRNATHAGGEHGNSHRKDWTQNRSLNLWRFRGLPLWCSVRVSPSRSPLDFNGWVHELIYSSTKLFCHIPFKNPLKITKKWFRKNKYPVERVFEMISTSFFAVIP